MDKVFKQQQQILSIICQNQTEIANQLKKYQNDIDWLGVQIESEKDTNKKVAHIEEREKLASTINTLNANQSKNETTLNTLYPSMQIKILKGLAVPPLKQIAANFIANHSVLYNPTSIPENVHMLANNAQQLAIINKYLMDLRIKSLSTNNIELLEQLINTFDTEDNDLPSEDTNFIIAIIIGDAASVHRILNCIEKHELKRLTEYFDKYVCNTFLAKKPGKALIEDHHPFYARILWLFSRNFLEKIEQFPQICFKSDLNMWNDWDMPFTERCDNHLWEIGNLVFNIFFSVLPKTIPIKKMLLQLACMYGSIDIVKFYCEQDPNKEALIE